MACGTSVAGWRRPAGGRRSRFERTRRKASRICKTEARLEHQTVLLDEGHCAFEVQFATVFGGERGQGLRVVVSTGLADPPEQCLQPAGRDDLEHSERVITGVPEGVPVPSRLGHQVACGRGDLDTVLDDTERTGQYEAVLIFASVAMRGAASTFDVRTCSTSAMIPPEAALSSR